ncbi:hypothetical protein [Castellaniella sp.]|uniref:hypothetical protein n=1 Tax=Castellaniella sp. TaxID=1955812 RepID=UPI003C7322B3
MATQYISYDQVPWYRKWWFAALGTIIFMPAIILMSFFGNFYFIKKGELKPFPKWYKFVLLGIFILAVLGSIQEQRETHRKQAHADGVALGLSKEDLNSMFQDALDEANKTVELQAAQESLAATPASEAPTACLNSKLVFACTTTKGKAVEICDSDDILQYSFGTKGHYPELSLSVPRSEASTFQWDGRGSEITYSVQIPNGDTVYEVFTSMSRMSNEHEIVSGINVEVAGKHVATLTCLDDTVQQDMEDIPLKPASWQ